MLWQLFFINDLQKTVTIAIDTALSLLLLLLLSTISTVCGQNGEIITQVLTRKRKAIIFFSLLFTVRHQKLYD